MDENILREFESYRNQLFLISDQRKQVDFQVAAVDLAVKELEKTKEKKVFKAIGNVLISEDRSKVLKELKEQKETLETRLKSFERQEKKLAEKLESLKMKIDAATKKK